MNSPDPDQDLPPTLPTSVVEYILAICPHFLTDLASVPIYSLLNVLPRVVVPTVHASLVGNVFSYEHEHVCDLTAALVRLFRDNHQEQQAKHLLARLQSASATYDHCLKSVVRAVCEAGNVGLLEYLATMQDVDLASQCETVVQVAAANGHESILTWWSDNQLSLLGLDKDAIQLAAQHGHLSVLKWWHALDPPISFDFARSDIVAKVIATGRLDVLEWWKANVARDRFVFEVKYWALASEHGHRSILQDAKRCDYALPRSVANCIDKAAENGHVHVLDWWFWNIGSGRVLDYTVCALDKASANGHVQVLNWFSKTGLALRFTPAALRLARDNGHSAVVDWWRSCPLFMALSVGGPLPLNAFQPDTADFVMLCSFGRSDWLSPAIFAAQSQDTMDRAVLVACQEGQVGVLHVVRAFYKLDSTLSIDHVNLAVAHNQLTSLQWCLRFMKSWPGLHWWLSSVRLALENGFVDILELLNAATGSSSSTPCLSWDDYGIKYVRSACRGGHVRTLEFLNSAMASSNSWNAATCLSAVSIAAYHGHVAVLDWLVQHGIDSARLEDEDHVVNWADIINTVSANGHDLVLQWWDTQHDFPFHFTEHALWNAVKNKHKTVVQWWIRSGKVCGMYAIDMLEKALVAMSTEE